MNLLRYANRLLKVTTPIVIPILRVNKSYLILLLLLSILLGFIPAIKSGIESNFLNETNQIINSPDSDYGSVITHKFVIKDDDDFLENLPNLFTNGQSLISVVLIYLIAIIITFIFDYTTEKVKTNISKSIFVSIRESAFRKALNTNPGDSPKMLNSAGNLSSAIQIGTGNITRVYEFLADAIQYLFLLVTSLLVIFTKAWLFGVVFLLTLLIQVFISVHRAKRLKEDRKDFEKKRNNLIGQTEDIISKKEIILAFEQEERYNQRITALSSNYGELSRSLDLRGFVYSYISKIINEIERFLIPLFAILFIIYFDGEAISSIGGVFFLITLYSRLSSPILSILSQYNVLKENEATSNSLLDLLELTNSPQKTISKLDQPDGSAITFHNVSFGYEKSKLIFSHLSFTIPKNKTTIILGPSGCGKSSIAKIILRFWSIESGNVYLMGQPIDSYSDKEIRLFTSYISQGDYIVDDTIRDNLNWGINEIGDELLMDALVKVRLAKSINDRFVLDRFAKDLSGGEQQRLSLARIILDHAQLLILDEPLTGVDVYTIKDLLPIFKMVLGHPNRTVVLISHKLSFIHTADYLVLLDSKGNIVEQGEPQKLLKDSETTIHKLYHSALEELTFKNA